LISCLRILGLFLGFITFNFDFLGFFLVWSCYFILNLRLFLNLLGILDLFLVGFLMEL
jgi:hypothetical protein